MNFKAEDELLAEEEKPVEQDDYMRSMSVSIEPATNGGVPVQNEKKTTSATVPIKHHSYTVSEINIEEDKPKEEPKDNGNGTLILVLVLLALTIGFVVYYYFIAKPDNNKIKKKKSDVTISSIIDYKKIK